MDAPKATPAYKLILTLGVAGLLSGLVIVSLYEGTRPRILAQQARALRAAVLEVLPGAVSMRPLVHGPDGWVPEAETAAGGVERAPDAADEGAAEVLDETGAAGPSGADTGRAGVTADGAGAGREEERGAPGSPQAPGQGDPAPLGERVFAAYDEAGELVGYAFEGQGNGFQDVIRLLYGYDPGSRRIVGMRVLESRETPGLGDKIYKDPKFVADFDALSVDPEILLVKGEGSGAPNEVHAITGATISSRAVVQIVRDTQARWTEELLGGDRPGPEAGAENRGGSDSGPDSGPDGAGHAGADPERAGEGRGADGT